LLACDGYDAALRIEDEVMLNARQREVAAELAPMVDRRGARRQDLDDDDGTVDSLSVDGRPRAAGDGRVRLVCRLGADAHGDPVGISPARQSHAAHGLSQGDIGLAFDVAVQHPLRRHHHRNAVVQLPTPFLALGPAEELFGRHIVARPNQEKAEGRYTPFLNLLRAGLSASSGW
jgi:hypothetical protein